jgi:hypothetical protein
MIKIFFATWLVFFCNGNAADSKTVKDRLQDYTQEVLQKNEPDLILSSSETVIPLTPHKIKLQKGISFTVNIPSGYNISVAAENLKRLRFLAKSPDGKLFATDMFDRSDNYKGRVLIFDKWNERTKKFDETITYLSGLLRTGSI